MPGLQKEDCLPATCRNASIPLPPADVPVQLHAFPISMASHSSFGVSLSWRYHSCMPYPTKAPDIQAMARRSGEGALLLDLWADTPLVCCSRDRKEGRWSRSGLSARLRVI